MSQRPPAWARRYGDDPWLFLVRVNDSLRLIVSATEGQPLEVLDVVHRETLETFAQAAARNGS